MNTDQIAAEADIFKDAESLARFFHDTYEMLAPSFGYETRPETREFNTQSKNGRLMVTVCGGVLVRVKSAIEKAIQVERERADHNADIADSIARASKQTEDALRQQIFELRAAHASEQDDTKLAQELTDLAYRVIIEHSGECEVENLPNEMQCRLDAAMRKET